MFRSGLWPVNDQGIRTDIHTIEEGAQIEGSDERNQMQVELSSERLDLDGVQLQLGGAVVLRVIGVNFFRGIFHGYLGSKVRHDVMRMRMVLSVIFLWVDCKVGIKEERERERESGEVGVKKRSVE